MSSVRVLLPGSSIQETEVVHVLDHRFLGLNFVSFPCTAALFTVCPLFFLRWYYSPHWIKALELFPETLLDCKFDSIRLFGWCVRHTHFLGVQLLKCGHQKLLLFKQRVPCQPFQSSVKTSSAEPPLTITITIDHLPPLSTKTCKMLCVLSWGVVS